VLGPRRQRDALCAGAAQAIKLSSACVLKKRKTVTAELERVELAVSAMDDQGRGIARVNGKVVFVDGALVGERVVAQYIRQRGRYDEARTVTVLTENPARVKPQCAHYDACGGCVLQHLDPHQQVRLKQARMLDNLTRLGQVRPHEVAPALVGSAWGYRSRARLGAKVASRKSPLVLGFRERKEERLARIETCDVLHPAMGKQIGTLTRHLNELSVRDRIAEVEIALTDVSDLSQRPPELGASEAAAGLITVRHLAPLSSNDRTLLRALGVELGLNIALQAAGSDSVAPLDDAGPVLLEYKLPEFDLTMRYGPADFTQVNAEMNRRMLVQAMQWLAPAELSSVLDLFCGIGNFTLPIARSGINVTGIEGAHAAVFQARLNASANGLANAEFDVADLNEPGACKQVLRGQFDGLVLDPPRAGAEAVVRALGGKLPRRIVYVSCSPASLARDLNVLVHTHGYDLRRVGIIDMFAHTNHVESMALLERD